MLVPAAFTTVAHAQILIPCMWWLVGEASALVSEDGQDSVGEGSCVYDDGRACFGADVVSTNDHARAIGAGWMGGPCIVRRVIGVLARRDLLRGEDCVDLGL